MDLRGVRQNVEECERAGRSEEWAKVFQRAISKNLNPLFKVHRVLLVGELPRTASNKIMRKALQARCRAELEAKAKARL